MCAELVEAPFDRLRAHGDKCALRAHGNHARSGLMATMRAQGSSAHR